MTWEHLKRGSSPVDWCEGNYEVSANIAEFVNTLSNILFLLLPPVLIYLFRDYGNFVNPGIHVIWVLLIVVGLSSAYFHATLSLIGQLLDEVAILWVCSAALSMFHPKKYYPKCLNGNRKAFSTIIGIGAIICTVLSCWEPAINAFALFLFLIPTVSLMYCHMKVEKNSRVLRLGIRSGLVMASALTCWIVDKFYCDTNFPYLHAIWHVLIFIAAYTSCVLFAYFAVKDEHPDRIGELKYWPANNFELGIPYVSIRCYFSGVRDQI